MVRVTETTGVYTWLAIRAGQLSRGRPLAVVLALGDHDRGAVGVPGQPHDGPAVVPITFLLADALDIDPVPLVIIEIIASNIGGTATLIGDPPNILIAGAHRALVRRLHRQPRADRRRHARRRHPRALLRLPLAAADRARGARARDGARRRAARSRTRPRLKRTVPILVADDPRLLRPQAAAPRAGDRRARRRRGDAARHAASRSQATIAGDRVADAVLPHRPVRDGRRAGGDRRDRRGRRRHRRRSPAATAPPSCSASSGCRRSAPGSSTTSRSPPR